MFLSRLPAARHINPGVAGLLQGNQTNLELKNLERHERNKDN